MADLIKRAVELADEWSHDGDDVQTPDGDILGDCVGIGDKMPQTYLDALAAQLVRQVDNLFAHFVHIHPTRTRIYGDHGQNEVQGPDRTMNTIKAIVDSGVLE